MSHETAPRNAFDNWLEWKRRIIILMEDYECTTAMQVKLSRLMEDMTPSAVPESTAGEPTFVEIIEFLRNEATSSMSNALARRTEPGERDQTEAELKAAKKIAEKMTGRKMDLVSTKPEDNRAYCDMQDRIADKYEQRATKLRVWAAFLEARAGAHPQPTIEQAVKFVADNAQFGPLMPSDIEGIAKLLIKWAHPSLGEAAQPPFWSAEAEKQMEDALAKMNPDHSATYYDGFREGWGLARAPKTDADAPQPEGEKAMTRSDEAKVVYAAEGTLILCISGLWSNARTEEFARRNVKSYGEEVDWRCIPAHARTVCRTWFDKSREHVTLES